MRRTIPPFRQLLEIEKIEWSTFKKLLPTKKDKRAFDEVFENARLYTSYLGNAGNPIVLESVIMGTLFHNYKTLLQINNKEDIQIDENSIREELSLLTENKPEGKLLFDRTCKKWHGLVDSLHKEDRELLLTMILEICNYDERNNMIINNQDSKSFIDYFFFLSAIVQQKKLIDMIENTSSIKSKNDVSLLDFM